MSPVKSSCIRTPWLPVTMIAAYADPGVRVALRMIPAFAHGTAARRVPPCGTPTALASDVTRTVRLPFPISAWCTK